MREILFRGKRIDNGEWVYGGYSYHNDLSRGFVVNVGVDNVSPIAWTVEVDPATVGQYTMLMDKNGKRIFEGDVVRSDNGKVGPVEYCQYEALYHVGIDPLQAFVWGTCNPETMVVEIEIIGNVYDNPEYMEPAP